MGTYEKKTLTRISIKFCIKTLVIKGDLYDPSVVLPPPHLTAAGSLPVARKPTAGEKNGMGGARIVLPIMMKL